MLEIFLLAPVSQGAEKTDINTFHEKRNR